MRAHSVSAVAVVSAVVAVFTASTVAAVAAVVVVSAVATVVGAVAVLVSGMSDCCESGHTALTDSMSTRSAPTGAMTTEDMSAGRVPTGTMVGTNGMSSTGPNAVRGIVRTMPTRANNHDGRRNAKDGHDAGDGVQAVQVGGAGRGAAKANAMAVKEG